LITLKKSDMEYSEEKSQRMERLLESKSFAQLNAEEKEFVLREAGSEREYNLLRKVSTALVAEKADLSPDPQSLRRLLLTMKNLKPAPWYEGVLTYKVPAYAVVLMITLFLALWLTPEKRSTAKPENIAAMVKTDTLFVSQPPDTVFVEKIIVRYRNVPPSEEDYTLVKNEVTDDVLPEGVSMKEKEELESLLVSGS
jgi:hypothetical protein